MLQSYGVKRILGLALILIGCFSITVLVQPVSAQQSTQSPKINMAPLNPEFLAWQRKEKSKSGFELLRDQQGRLHGIIPSPFDWSHLRSQEVSYELLEVLPAKFDLRDIGYVTPVKDKGECGCCWAFATYGSLESWLLKNKGQTWDLSENHLKNHHGFDISLCEGGSSDMSTAYLARWSGPVRESDDPYHSWDDRPSPGGPCQMYVGSVLRLTTDDEIKNWLWNNKAGMFVSMYWDPDHYNSSNNTYYYSGSNDTDHGVTLVGWDDDKAVSGAPGKGAWIVKNDFGTDWGENGYFYISYYDAKAVQFAVAFCDAVPTSTYISNYQYDPLGHTSSVGDGEKSTFWGANIFTATANEYLGAVGFYALAKNTSYEIYVYNNFDGNRFSGLLDSVSGTSMYPGYCTVKLPSLINLTNGNDFSIVIKFTTPGIYYPVPIEDRINNYSTGATANTGESYFSFDGVSFTDITSQSGYEHANICIKGLTVPPPSVVDIGLRVYDGTAIIKIACEPEGTLTSPLRIAKNGVIYGIVLVDTTDPDATGIRVQTSSGVKALRKY